MHDYALPDPDTITAIPVRLLMIGTGFIHPGRKYQVEQPADALAALAAAGPHRWDAILIDGAAITPAIASALRAAAPTTPLIIAAGDHDADQVGLVLDLPVTVTERPVNPARLENLLAEVALSSGVADGGSFAADERIMALQRDAERMTAAISELARQHPTIENRPVTAARIRAHLRARRLRERFFNPELFADPAWDMLLDLGASRLEGRKVSVSSLCIAAAVPTTTALRWVKALVDRGIFERESDPDDARRAFIHLSPTASQALDSCLDLVLNQPGQ